MYDQRYERAMTDLPIAEGTNKKIRLSQQSREKKVERMHNAEYLEYELVAGLDILSSYLLLMEIEDVTDVIKCR